VDILTLLVVDFLLEEIDPSEESTVYPFGEKLQEVVVEAVGGES